MYLCLTLTFPISNHLTCKEQNLAKSLLDFEKNNVEQNLLFATRNNILDLGFTNNMEFIQCESVMVTIFSDHK